MPWSICRCANFFPLNCAIIMWVSAFEWMFSGRKKKTQLFLTLRLKENILLFHFQSTLSSIYLSNSAMAVFLWQGSQLRSKGPVPWENSAQIEIKSLSKCARAVEISLRIPAKHPHHSVTLRIIQIGTLRWKEMPAFALFLSHMALAWAMGIREPWEYKDSKAAVCFCVQAEWRKTMWPDPSA